MSLSPGARLGPYEITAAIGAGGMGEVYRARDAKLGRNVAIKILPDLFLADAERLARFEREARTLASLNHPNIAQIYGMEDRALVMELVEGEDLSVMLSRGALPAAEALLIAQQVAQALEAAHEIGIVHRDLKPANIKIRNDGTVKVLDFGLAKAMDASGSVSGSLANSPTITSPATKMGMILGTAAYMSPEQARGKAVDRRGDVWAFGVVLYEMLTGKRAFDGTDVSDVLASVLKDTIPLDTLPADTPPAVRRLLRRCLVKNRADRLDSMATARLEIADAVGAAEESQKPTTGAGAAGPGRLLAVAIGVAGLGLGLAAGWGLFRSTTTTSRDVVRFSIPLPADVRPTAVAIAGDLVVYETDRLYTRRLSEAEPHALPGTDGARNLFLSPDGRWIGFFAGGKIRRVAASGGDPLTIADADIDTPGAAWGPDNTVLFTAGWNAPVQSVPADGGKPVQMSTVDTAAGERGHWWPEVLPDGKHALITVWMAATGINDAKLAVLDLATGKHRVLMPGAAAKYLSSGHLLFFQAGGYHLVPFDPVAIRTTGDSVKVLPDALPQEPLGSRVKPITVSPTGTLAYVSGALIPEIQLAWASTAGAIEPLPGPPLRWRDLMLSPDGRRLAGVRIEGGTTVLRLHDLTRQTDQAIDLPGANSSPLWNAASDSLVFTSLRTGHFDAYQLRLSDGVVRPIIEEPFDQAPAALTRDGKRMILYDYLADGTLALTVADLDQPKSRTRLQMKAGTSNDLRLSPDDKWLAEAVTDSARREIVVVAFPGPGGPVQVSSRGGRTPIWSRTGSTLYYQRGDELIAATYATAGGRFTIEGEKVLFRLAGHDLVDLAPDGRFLLAKKLPGETSSIQVVLNWFTELAK